MPGLRSERTEIRALRRATTQSRERASTMLNSVQTEFARTGFRLIRQHPVASITIVAAGVAVLAILGHNRARRLDN
jgi:hypothetical protein